MDLQARGVETAPQPHPQPATMCDDSEEKQLLVRQSGTTVINMDSFVMHRTLRSGGGSNRGAGSMTSLSPLSESPSTSSLSLSPSSMLQAENSALQRLRFEELVQRSECEDLSSLEKNHCIYEAGRDRQGRPVIAFIGKWFPYERIDLDKALLYLIRVLQPIVTNGPYVVVYFHSKTTRGNIPHYWWIKHVYNSLGYEYKKNLKAFYVVHPTMWTRMTCWWFSTFMAPAIKNKICNIFALQELTTVGITEEDSDLDIPMFIAEYDMTLHGIRYYSP